MDNLTNHDVSKTELVFFDTFSHLDNEDANLDLVQFSSPVRVTEIRVIPLGARVEADFPGGVRLGATNPSSFSLQFFVNDLSAPSVSTFLDIGTFDYQQNVNIQYIINNPKPTDGLLLKGRYSTLTLAVFGEKTELSSFENVEESVFSAESPVNSKADDFYDPGGDGPSDIIDDRENFALSNVIEKCKRVDASLHESYTPPEELRTSRDVKSPNENVRSRASSRGSSGRHEKVQRQSSPIPRSRSRSRNERNHIARESSRTRDRRRSSSRTPQSARHHESSRSSKPRTSPRRYSRRSKTPETRHKSVRSPLHVKSRSPSRHSWSDLRKPERDVSLHRENHSNVQHSSRHREKKHRISRSPSTERRRIPVVPGSEVVSNNINLSIVKTEPPEQMVAPSLPIDEDLLDPISPEQSLEEIGENISDDDNLDDLESFGKDNLIQSEGGESALEAISSEDEDINDIVSEIDDVTSLDFGDLTDEVFVDSFDPCNCSFAALKHFGVSHQSTRAEDLISSLGSKLDVYRDHTKRDEKWVEEVENLCQNDFRTLDHDVIEDLVEWLEHGLNFDAAMKQTVTAFKVRHIKAGLKLSSALFETDGILSKLLNNHVPFNVLQLFDRPQMTIPIKLCILKATDDACSHPVAMKYFLEEKHNWNNLIGPETCYQHLLRMTAENPPKRIVAAISALLNKVRLFESLEVFQSEENSSVKLEALAFISSSLNNMESFTHPPIRSLPSTIKFEVTSFDRNAQLIFSWMTHFNFVQSLNTMFKSSVNTDTFGLISEVLEKLLNSSQGIQFLLAENNVCHTNNLQIALVQDRHLSDQSLHMSIRFSSTLHAFSLIDEIIYFQHQNSCNQIVCNDDPAIASALHKLYTLTLTEPGRHAVVCGLSFDKNLKALLGLLNCDDNDLLPGRACRTLTSTYASELLILTVRCQDDVSFLERHLEDLKHLVEQGSLPNVIKLGLWLVPLGNLPVSTISEAAVKSHVEWLKKEADRTTKCAANSFYIPKPQVVTALRCLHKLCIGDSYEILSKELKFHYAITQVHALDGMTHLLTILQKLTESILKPLRPSLPLTSSDSLTIMAFITPAVRIMHKLLQHLISVRQKDFRDCTPISTILKLFSVMAITPQNSPIYRDAQRLKDDLVETLSLFTNVFAEGNEVDDAVLIKSNWSKMLLEVLEYCLSSPLVFSHGLDVLSRLLPEILPMRVDQQPKANELARLLNARKIWTAHIHLLNSNFENVITSLAFSSLPEVRVPLQRVSLQLANLSAPTAIIVSKCVLDALSKAMVSDFDNKRGRLENSLSFVVCLLPNPAARLAIIHSLFVSSKKLEYETVLPKLIQIFISTPDTSVTLRLLLNHFFSAICDHNINLYGHPGTRTQEIMNSSPPKDAINLIISAYFKKLSFTSTADDIVGMLKFLEFMSGTDYGKWTIVQNFSKHSTLYNILEFASRAMEHEKESILKLLDSLINLLKIFVNRGGMNGGIAKPPVNHVLEDSDIARILRWQNDTDSSHPVLLIKNFLASQPEMSSPSLSWLTDLLSRSSDAPLNVNWLEPSLPSAELFTSQYSSRQVVSTVKEVPALEEHSCFDKRSGTQVSMNLINLGQSYCGSSFDILTALHELCKSQQYDNIDSPSKSDLPVKQRLNEEFLISAKETPAFGKRQFQAPARGRGFNRQTNMHSNRNHDPFRSRPPNTSRPPSMHVDDFVAMERGHRDVPVFSNAPKRNRKRSGGALSPTPIPIHYVETYNARKPLPNHSNSGTANARYVREEPHPRPNQSTTHWSKSGGNLPRRELHDNGRGPRNSQR